jgi:hypothetical protein
MPPNRLPIAMAKSATVAPLESMLRDQPSSPSMLVMVTCRRLR